MGQVCCSGSEEKKNDIFQDRSAGNTAFGVDEGNDILISDDNKNYGDGADSKEMITEPSLPGETSASVGALLSSGASPGERLKKLREEQARLELIVQNAGRGMVAVRSTRGSTGYYDQGFAAALAQHLEQTTQFPNQLPIRLPLPLSASQLENHNVTVATNSKSISSPSSNNPTQASDGGSSSEPGATSSMNASTKSVYSRLSQPQWEGIVLGIKGGGLAGCGGENPNTYMDHIAASYLDSVVPKKGLFAGVGPMVENLL